MGALGFLTTSITVTAENVIATKTWRIHWKATRREAAQSNSESSAAGAKIAAAAIVGRK